MGASTRHQETRRKTRIARRRRFVRAMRPRAVNMPIVRQPLQVQYRAPVNPDVTSRHQAIRRKIRIVLASAKVTATVFLAQRGTLDV